MVIEQLVKDAKARVQGAKENLAKFAANLVEHPESALHRSASTPFSATASLLVWTEILNDAEAGAEPSAILSSLEGHIYYTAANPPHSSNQLDNYLGLEKNRERAAAAKHVQRLISVAGGRTQTAAT